MVKAFTKLRVVSRFKRLPPYNVYLPIAFETLGPLENVVEVSLC